MGASTSFLGLLWGCWSASRVAPGVASSPNILLRLLLGLLASILGLPATPWLMTADNFLRINTLNRSFESLLIGLFLQFSPENIQYSKETCFDYMNETGYIYYKIQ